MSQFHFGLLSRFGIRTKEPAAVTVGRAAEPVFYVVEALEPRLMFDDSSSTAMPKSSSRTPLVESAPFAIDGSALPVSSAENWLAPPGVNGTTISRTTDSGSIQTVAVTPAAAQDPASPAGSQPLPTVAALVTESDSRTKTQYFTDGSYQQIHYVISEDFTLTCEPTGKAGDQFDYAITQIQGTLEFSGTATDSETGDSLTVDDTFVYNPLTPAGSSSLVYSTSLHAVLAFNFSLPSQAGTVQPTQLSFGAYSGGYETTATILLPSEWQFDNLYYATHGSVNLQVPSVTGNIFSDTNDNGVRDTDEPGQAAVTVFADYSGTGELTSIDPQTTTDASGNYHLDLPWPDTWPIREVAPGGMFITEPATGYYDLPIAAAQILGGEDFGNASAALAVKSVSTADSKSLSVSYTVANNNANTPFTINIYRSGVFLYAPNSPDQVLIATVAVGSGQDSDGTHAITISPSQFLQSQALRPDPAHPYVIATADDDGTLDPSDKSFPPQAEFQIFLLGAVVHGFVSNFVSALTTGQTVNYGIVDTFAAELIADDGYALTTFGFHWEAVADVPKPGIAVSEGDQLAHDVSQAAAQLTSNPDDVVDLNLIGWSRGSVVITEAMTDFKDNPGSYFPQLEHGFMMETLVDPHPANNSVSGYSAHMPNVALAATAFLPGLLGALGKAEVARIGVTLAAVGLYKSFQAAAVDPPIVIPGNVQAVAEIFQNSPASDFGFGNVESILNLWGLNPSLISSPVPIISYNETGLGIGHSEIFENVYQNVITAHATLTDLGLQPFGGDPLAITTNPPATAPAGAPFGMVVTAENSDGTVNTSFNGSVTVSDYGGSMLGGNTTVNAINGIATFTGLTEGTAGNHYLEVTSSGFPTVYTSIVVTAAQAMELVASAPTGPLTNGAFGLTVNAEDQFGNVDSTFNGNVTLALASNPGSATLGGILTVQAVNGVANFSGLTINKVGIAYTLQATSSGFTNGTTPTFDVTDQLVVTAPPPANVPAGTPFSLAVTAEDANGIMDTSFNGSATLGVNSDVAGGSLLGTLTVAVVGGVANFSGISLSDAGSYSLTASGKELSAVTTSLFNVTAAVATQLVVSDPTGSVLTNTPFSLSVSAVDPFGQIDPNFNGAITLELSNNPGGSLSGVLTANATNGVATFGGLTLNIPGSGYTIQASSTGLVAGTSAPFAITNDQLVVTVQPPADVVVGSGFGFSVSAENSAGTVDTAFDGTVTVVPLGSFVGSAATLGGAFTSTAVNGIATFSGLTMAPAGYYVLSVSASGASPTATNSIDVSSAGATQLRVTTPPPAAVTAGADFNLAVSVEDAYGNVDTNFSGTVTLALSDNPGGSTLGGTLTATAVGGIASFLDLTLNEVVNGYTLLATSAGVSSATTSSFAVTPAGVATQLVLTTQPPASIIAGDSFSATVTAEDGFGMVDAAFDGSVTLALANNSVGGTLGGTLITTAINGVATFSGLTLDEAGDGYSLSATSGTFSSATTNSINVKPATAIQLAVSAPDGNVLANSPFGLFVYAEDAYGNVNPSFNGNVTIALAGNPGTAALGGALTATALNGIISFPGLTINNPGLGYTIQSISNGLIAGASTPFNVTIDQLVVTSPPPSAIGTGSDFGFVVSAENGSGNVDASFAGNVTVSLINFGSNSSTLGGVLTMQLIKGKASFSGLSVNQSGYYMLLATATNTGPAATNPLEVLTITLSQSPVLVGSPVINGDNPNGLFTAAGQPTQGAERSMVEDIVYTFSEPVSITNANLAFTLLVLNGSGGVVPGTLIATAVSGSNNTQWALSLTGQADGVLASIANGQYSIAINPQYVLSVANGTALAQGRTDTFYRLYGDINGDEVVNAADNFQFKKALTTYNPAFDVNEDGAINAADNFQFKKELTTSYAGFAPTI